MDTEKAEQMDAFLDFMIRHGFNTTSQRKAIAEAFFDLPGHHSLDEFYKHVVERDTSIGLTTVYRTLKLLCDAGVAHETQFSDNITRYEVAIPNKHHDHLICINCGKIVEICDPKIEAIQRTIARKNNFVLCGHSHNLYGVCPACQEKKKTKTR